VHSLSKGRIMKLLFATLLCTTLGTAGWADGCGGKFSNFVAGLKAEAVSKGHDAQDTHRAICA